MCENELTPYDLIEKYVKETLPDTATPEERHKLLVSSVLMFIRA